VKRQKKRRTKRAKAETPSPERKDEAAPGPQPATEPRVEVPRPSFPRASVYLFAASMAGAVLIAGVLEWILS
jgi:hypothetical protein